MTKDIKKDKQMKYWTTKDGDTMPIRKMEDSHLINTIKYLERKAEKGIMIGGGYAWDIDSLWADVVYGKEALDTIPEYRNLVKEANRRKL